MASAAIVALLFITVSHAAVPVGGDESEPCPEKSYREAIARGTREWHKLFEGARANVDAQVRALRKLLDALSPRDVQSVVWYSTQEETVRTGGPGPAYPGLHAATISAIRRKLAPVINAFNDRGKCPAGFARRPRKERVDEDGVLYENRCWKQRGKTDTWDSTYPDAFLEVDVWHIRQGKLCLYAVSNNAMLPRQFCAAACQLYLCLDPKEPKSRWLEQLEKERRERIVWDVATFATRDDDWNLPRSPEDYLIRFYGVPRSCFKKR